MPEDSSNPIHALGTILGIWAHPDDETFMVGGILAQAVENGQKVICVTATKGEAGVQDVSRWPSEELGSIREKEMHDALHLLGIREHHWLDCEDGKCNQADHSSIVTFLTQLIEEQAIDTILTFPPDGQTGHPDHRCVSAWAREAAHAARNQSTVYFAVNTVEDYESYLKVLDERINIYFATDSPQFIPEAECEIAFHLPPHIATRKVAALRAMPSQTTRLFAAGEEFDFDQVFGREALVHERHASRWADL